MESHIDLCRFSFVKQRDTHCPSCAEVVPIIGEHITQHSLSYLESKTQPELEIIGMLLDTSSVAKHVLQSLTFVFISKHLLVLAAQMWLPMRSPELDYKNLFFCHDFYRTNFCLTFDIELALITKRAQNKYSVLRRDFPTWLFSCLSRMSLAQSWVSPRPSSTSFLSQ